MPKTDCWVDKSIQASCAYQKYLATFKLWRHKWYKDHDQSGRVYTSLTFTSHYNTYGEAKRVWCRPRAAKRYDSVSTLPKFGQVTRFDIAVGALAAQYCSVLISQDKDSRHCIWLANLEFGYGYWLTGMNNYLTDLDCGHTSLNCGHTDAFNYRPVK